MPCQVSFRSLSTVRSIEGRSILAGCANVAEQDSVDEKFIAEEDLTGFRSRLENRIGPFDA
jgi:hypothetical protein